MYTAVQKSFVEIFQLLYTESLIEEYQQRRQKEQLPNEAMMANASDDCAHVLTHLQ